MVLACWGLVAVDLLRKTSMERIKNYFKEFLNGKVIVVATLFSFFSIPVIAANGDVHKADLVIGGKTYPGALIFTEKSDGTLTFTGFGVIDYTTDLDEKYLQQFIAKREEDYTPSEPPAYSDDYYYIKYTGGDDGFVWNLTGELGCHEGEEMSKYYRQSLNSEWYAMFQKSWWDWRGWGDSPSGSSGRTYTYYASSECNLNNGKTISVDYDLESHQTGVRNNNMGVCTYDRTMFGYEEIFESEGMSGYIPIKYFSKGSYGEFAAAWRKRDYIEQVKFYAYQDMYNMVHYWWKDNINYQDNSNHFDEIEEYKEALSTMSSFTIPSSCDGMSVTDVNWTSTYVDEMSLASLSFPSTVQRITSIPSIVRTSTLTSVNISSLPSLTYIGNNALSGCTSLVIDSLSLAGKSVGSTPFNGVTIRKLNIENTSTYSQRMLTGVKNCTAYIRYNTMQSVANYLPSDYSFDSNSKIYVPYLAWNDYQTSTGWKEIKDQIYYYGSAEFYVLVDGEQRTEGVFYTGNGANCVMLTAIGSNGKGVGEQVLEIPETITITNEDGHTTEDYVVNAIGSSSKQDVCAGLTCNQVVLPSTVTNLNYGAFRNCTNLTSINTDNVTNVDDYAFKGCTSLASISLPKTTGVDSYAFEGCTSLTAISLPLCTSVGSYAFSGCTNMESVSLPRVTYANSYVYQNCGKIKNITLPETTGASSYAFYNATGLEVLSLPKCTSINSQIVDGCEHLDSVNIPRVTYFSSNAFKGNTTLRSVHLASSMEELQNNYGISISESAFEGCTNLQNINLEMVYYVGNKAFKNCKNLTEANLLSYSSYSSSGVDYSPWQGCDALRKVRFYDGNHKTCSYTINIPAGWFYNMKSLEEVDLGIATYNLDDSCFARCYKLKTVNFNNLDGRYSGGVSFRKKCFMSCNALTSIVTDKAGYFDQRAFYSCDNLQTVDLTGSPSTGMSTEVFAFCEKLKSVTLPERLTSIGGERTFYKDAALETINLDNVTYIGKMAFDSCCSLKEVTLKNVSTIGDYAFRMSGLTSIHLPGTLSYASVSYIDNSDHDKGIDFANSSFAIGKYAFLKCYDLQSIAIDEGVQGIGNSAFQFVPSVKTVSLPNSLKYIGAHFLCGSKDLTTLTIPSSVTDIDGAFLHGCESLRKVYLLGEPSMLKLTSRGGESFGPVDPGDPEYGDWPEHEELTCKHVNDCEFIVNDEATYNRYITYVNNDEEMPWLRLDRYDFDYNLKGSDNPEWGAVKYYKKHTTDFKKNWGLDGEEHPNAYEDAYAAIYGSGSAPSQRAPRRITPEQKMTYKDLYTLTGYHNRYQYFPNAHTVTIYEGKWSTICFPKYIPDNLDEILGDGGVVAILTSAVLDRNDPMTDIPNEKYMYHLTFTPIPISQMQPDEPYLIRPGMTTEVEIPVYDDEHPMEPADWTKTVIKTVQATEEVDGTETDISMVGTYLDYKLRKAEFYLKNYRASNSEPWSMKFYKNPSDGASSVVPFKCYFKIVKNGVQISNAILGNMLLDSDTDGIGDTPIADTNGEWLEVVYTLNGMRVTNTKNLKPGIYIMNGRKVVVK